jgi:hypothetical protein
VNVGNHQFDYELFNNDSSFGELPKIRSITDSEQIHLSIIASYIDNDGGDDEEKEEGRASIDG